MTSPQSLIAQLGTVMQLAFVPKDFDAALRHWTETMGVGPFFRMSHVTLLNTKHEGLPVEIDFSECLQSLRNRVVLITGAAGSIGSELARQVMGFGPSALDVTGNSRSQGRGQRGRR